MKKLVIAMVVALLAAMAIPVTTAFADDEIDLECSLSLQVVDPGTDVVNGNKVTNSNQVASGLLDCNEDALDGVMTTLHGSRVEFNQATGEFKGKLRGAFSLETFGGDTHTGKLKTRVAGAMLLDGSGNPLLNVLGNVITVGETVDGKWEMGSSVEGEGNFDIALLPADLVDGGGTPITKIDLGGGIFLINVDESFGGGDDPTLTVALDVGSGLFLDISGSLGFIPDSFLDPIPTLSGGDGTLSGEVEFDDDHDEHGNDGDDDEEDDDEEDDDEDDDEEDDD